MYRVNKREIEVMHEAFRLLVKLGVKLDRSDPLYERTSEAAYEIGRLINYAKEEV